MSHTFSFICIKLIVTPLRHVQGFPLLGLLWEFRCHAGYSEAQPHSPLAFRFRQSTFRQVLTIGTADSSDATFVSFRLLRLRCGMFLHCSKCREAMCHITTTTALRRNYFNGHKTIVQPIQASSLCLPFFLAVQSWLGN